MITEDNIKIIIPDKTHELLESEDDARKCLGIAAFIRHYYIYKYRKTLLICNYLLILLVSVQILTTVFFGRNKFISMAVIPMVIISTIATFALPAYFKHLMNEVTDVVQPSTEQIGQRRVSTVWKAAAVYTLCRDSLSLSTSSMLGLKLCKHTTKDIEEIGKMLGYEDSRNIVVEDNRGDKFSIPRVLYDKERNILDYTPMAELYDECKYFLSVMSENMDKEDEENKLKAIFPPKGKENAR